MDGMILHDLLWAVGMALAGGIIFSGIGLISGTDETSTIAPLTLLIILLGVPPVAVFSWFMAAAISKHMIHAIPTALMGVPGDTMAVPMLEGRYHCGVYRLARQRRLRVLAGAFR